MLKENIKRGFPKKLFIHIGSHKTGTTAIQYTLSTMNKQLHDEVGLCYPDAGKELGDGHHMLAASLLQDDFVPWDLPHRVKIPPDYRTFDKFFQEINCSKCDKILISSEVFENYQLKQIRILADHLRMFDVTIILFVRDQVSFLVSAWMQLFKSGVTRLDFTNWVESLLSENQRLLAHFGNYWTMINNWGSVFGKKNIKVVKYNRNNDKSWGVLKLLQICGINQYDNISPIPVLNVSPGEIEINIFKELISSQNYSPDQIFWIFRIFDQLFKELEIKDQPYKVLEGVANKIRNYFSVSNAMIAQEYLDGDQFEEEQVSISDKNIKPLNNLSMDQIIQLFSRLTYLLVNDLELRHGREVQDKVSLIEQLTQMLSEKEEILANNAEILDEKNSLLAKRDDELADKNSLLAKRDDELADKNSLLAKRDDELADKNILLLDNKKTLSANEALIKESEKQIAEKNAVLSYYANQKISWGTEFNNYYRVHEKENILRRVLPRKRANMIDTIADRKFVDQAILNLEQKSSNYIMTFSPYVPYEGYFEYKINLPKQGCGLSIYVINFFHTSLFVEIVQNGIIIKQMNVEITTNGRQAIDVSDISGDVEVRFKTNRNHDLIRILEWTKNKIISLNDNTAPELVVNIIELLH